MNNEEKILSMLEGLVTKVDTLETDVSEIKDHVLLMEHNQSENFRVLHDAHIAHRDVIEDIRTKLSDMDDRQENQELHIKLLRDKTKTR